MEINAGYRKPSAYLAGPMARHSLKEAMEWRITFKNMHKENFNFYLPGLAEGLEIVETTEVIQHTHTKKGISIVGLDYALVTASDILIANVSYAHTKGSGTTSEIAWAYAARKPIIVVRGEDNVYNTPFINEQATAVVGTLKEAADVLYTLVGL